MNRTRLNRMLHTWHRRISLLACFFVLVLSITGLLLNNTGSFELDKKPITSPSLLALYGVSVPEQIEGYKLNDNWITIFAGRIWLNGNTLGDCISDDALVQQDDMALYFFCQSGVWAFTHQGEMLEYMESMSFGMQALSQFEGQKQFLPNLLVEKVLDQGYVKDLHWERLMLDLHSGRLFGWSGERLMDVAAIFLIWLSLSGLWMAALRYF